MKTYINLLATVAAFASAAFWFQAASINPPWAAMNTLGGTASDVIRQLRRQGRWNGYAALASAVSVLLQWFALAV